MFFLIPFLTFLSSAKSFPTQNLTKNDELEQKQIVTSLKDCKSGIFDPVCIKLSVIALIEKLNAKGDVQLLPGVELVREENENQRSTSITAELIKALPSTDERIDKYLLYRLGTYLDTHSVKLKLLDSGVVEEARMLDEARKKDSLIGGKKGGLGTLIAMAMMMKGTLMSVGLGGLALLAGKALMTAMMSLLLSAIIGLKSLTSGGKSTTYEIVSKPIYSHSHSHSTAHEDVGAYGHEGYGRSMKNTRRR